MNNTPTPAISIKRNGIINAEHHPLKALLLSSILLTACITPPLKLNPEALGQYNIIKRTCTGNDFMKAQCHEIKLLEFVRGKFYKIAKNETAFIMWHGKKNEALMYSARKYRGDINISKEESLLIYIEKNDRINEYIELFSHGRGKYIHEGYSSDNALSYRMAFEIKKINPENKSGYITKYPERD